MAACHSQVLLALMYVVETSKLPSGEVKHAMVPGQTPVLKSSTVCPNDSSSLSLSYKSPDVSEIVCVASATMYCLTLSISEIKHR